MRDPRRHSALRTLAITCSSDSGRIEGSAEARTRAKDTIRDASKGADPAADKQAHRQAETIADLVTDYVEKHAKRKKRSWREDTRILNSYVLPTWKHRAIADIRRRDVRELLDPIAERAPVMANRVLACVRKMFAFAIDREWIEANPASRMGRRVPSTPAIVC